MIEMLNILVTHATLDGLTGAAVMATGAATLDIPVNIFLSHDAVYAVKKDQLDKMLEVNTNFPEVKEAYMKKGMSGEMMPWYKLLADAKELGDIKITACGLAVDIFGIKEDEFADFVDEVGGVADFLGNAEPEDLTVTF